jgi:hypothetical protein
MHIIEQILNYIIFNKITHTKNDKILNIISLLHLFFSRCLFCLPDGSMLQLTSYIDYKNITFVLLNYEFYSRVNKLHLDDPRE